MIDADAARALPFPKLVVGVERGRLRSFARAIGETDPAYVDVDAARAAGHRDLPVPPTFFFSLGLEVPDPLGYLDLLGLDLGRVVHGEQSFVYHQMAYAGDTLVLQDRIADVYAKRGGALEFVAKDTEVTRDDEALATTRSVIVVRRSEART